MLTQNNLTLVMKRKIKEKYTVFIDPGHGGNDKGTESKTSNRYEKDLNLQIAKKLANKLSKQRIFK